MIHFPHVVYSVLYFGKLLYVDIMNSEGYNSHEELTAYADGIVLVAKVLFALSIVRILYTCHETPECHHRLASYFSSTIYINQHSITMYA